MLFYDRLRHAMSVLFAPSSEDQIKIYRKKIKKAEDEIFDIESKFRHKYYDYHYSKRKRMSIRVEFLRRNISLWKKEISFCEKEILKEMRLG